MLVTLLMLPPRATQRMKIRLVIALVKAALNNPSLVLCSFDEKLKVDCVQWDKSCLYYNLAEAQGT